MVVSIAKVFIFLQNVKHIHPHPKNSMKTNNNILPQDKIEAQQPAECGLDGAACCASSVMEDSGRTTDDHASKSDTAPRQDRVDKAIDEWNRESRSMGIGLRSVDYRGHQRLPHESPQRNLGSWIGRQVLASYDCGLDGYKLVLKSGKKVSLNRREFMA